MENHEKPWKTMENLHHLMALSCTFTPPKLAERSVAEAHLAGGIPPPPPHPHSLAMPGVLFPGATSMIHFWLVGQGHPSEKYEFVNWDDEIPNIWENKKCSKPPTSGATSMIHLRLGCPKNSNQRSLGMDSPLESPKPFVDFSSPFFGTPETPSEPEILWKSQVQIHPMIFRRDMILQSPSFWGMQWPKFRSQNPQEGSRLDHQTLLHRSWESIPPGSDLQMIGFPGLFVF